MNIYSGNETSSKVEAVGTFRLILKTGFMLDLENTFCIPSFSRNLISVSKLVQYGFSFMFDKKNFSLLKNKSVVGGGILINGLFQIDLDSTFEHNCLSLYTNVGIKRNSINENSSIMRHERFRHISIQRIQRLVKEGILKNIFY